MKKIILISLCLVLLLTVACNSNKETELTGYEAEIQKPGTLVVATSPDYPPFEALEGEELVGFDIELMYALAKEIGVEIDFRQLDWTVIISTLQSGQVDLGLAAFTYAPDRDVLFSTPYYMSAQVAVVREDSDINTLDDLKGKKLTAGLGTTGDEAAKNVENADVIYPDDYMVGFEMLKNGQVDAVICDLGVGKEYNSMDNFKMLDEYLQKEEMSIIIKKGNEELLKTINEAIEKFMKTDAYTELMMKWDLE